MNVKTNIIFFFLLFLRNGIAQEIANMVPFAEIGHLPYLLQKNGFYVLKKSMSFYLDPVITIDGSSLTLLPKTIESSLVNHPL